MNDSDSRFEDQLKEGLAAWTDDLEVPDGLGNRRDPAGAPPDRPAPRERRRAGGRRRRGRRRARVRGRQRLAVRWSPVKALDASQVYERVSAQVRQLGASDGVIETVSTIKGWKHPEMVRWVYTRPHPGIQYSYAKTFDSHGRYVSGYWNRASRLGDHRIKNVQINLLPQLLKYSVGTGITHAQSDELYVGDSTEQIAQSLSKGHIHLGGTTTLEGQSALRVEQHVPRGTETLYVNANTYRPIEQVIRYSYHHGRLVVTDRLYLRPATKANIAKATTRPKTKGWRRY